MANVASASTSEYFFTAARMPVETPMITSMSTAQNARRMLAGAVSFRIVFTLRLVRYDVPRSPRTTFFQ